MSLLDFFTSKTKKKEEPVKQSKPGGVGPSPLTQQLMKAKIPPPQPMPSHSQFPERRLEASGGHPVGVPESYAEQVIKGAASKWGNLVKEDDPYLEQYFHPNMDILEKQYLRPTKTSGKDEDLPYRKMALSEVEYEDPNPQFKPDVKLNFGGLGHYTFDNSNPNYSSVYDKWDFDTETPLYAGSEGVRGILPSIYDYVAKQVMKKAGQPYAIYDRFPKGYNVPLLDIPVPQKK